MKLNPNAKAPKPTTEVRFAHYRYIENGVIDSRGGATIAYVPAGEGKPVVWAGAFCHPNDNFNKHMGRVKSAGRLRSESYLEVTEFTDNQAFLQHLDDSMITENGLVRKYSHKSVEH